MQVGGALDQLLSLLQGAVDRTSWVDEFGMTADFGIGDLQNPYVRICRAECMLAALMLHVLGPVLGVLLRQAAGRIGKSRESAARHLL